MVAGRTIRNAIPGTSPEGLPRTSKPDVVDDSRGVVAKPREVVELRIHQRCSRGRFKRVNAGCKTVAHRAADSRGVKRGHLRANLSIAYSVTIKTRRDQLAP